MSTRPLGAAVAGCARETGCAAETRWVKPPSREKGLSPPEALLQFPCPGLGAYSPGNSSQSRVRVCASPRTNVRASSGVCHAQAVNRLIGFCLPTVQFRGTPARPERAHAKRFKRSRLLGKSIIFAIRQTAPHWAACTRDSL